MQYKITIFTSANLTYWAGVEKAIYYYCLYSPDDFKIKIINNPYTSKINIPLESIGAIFPKADIVELDLKKWKMSSNYPRLSNFFLRTVVLERILISAETIKKRKEIKSVLADTDLIYFIQNSLSGLIHKKFKKPVIIGSEHVYDFYTLGQKGIVKRMIFKLLIFGLLNHKIDKIHLISNASFQIYRSNSRFFCVPNGVDTLRFYPSLQLQSGKIKLLFASRLEPAKGILDLLDAFSAIDSSNFDLYIVGNGSLLETIKRKKCENIHVLGFLEEDQLEGMFRTSDVLVFPTKAESFPLVVLEALSAGLYVMTTDILREKFKDFEELESINFVSADKHGIMNGIRSIASNIDYIRNLGRKKKAHEFMEKNYDWKVVVDMLYCNFRSFIDESGTS